MDKLKTWSGEEETRDILFSLDRYYSEEIFKNQEEMQNITSDLNDLDDLCRIYKNENLRIDQERQETSEKLGILRERLASFEKFEADCQKKLNISIHRTMTRELSADEVESAQKLLGEELNRLTLCGEGLKRRLSSDSERRDTLVSGRKELSDKLFDVSLRG